jgi:ATPases involved in chromosome partitioning
MRVVMFTAIKGGVGVSTLVLMLAKALAKRGAKVTLVDMDVTGYISGIAGIHDKGLLAQVVDGENLRGTHINKVDGIQVLKFLGDGMRFF